MNKVTLALRLFETGCVDDGAARRVGFDGAGESGRVGEIKNGLQHLDHVVERVLVVIQDYDVILLAELVFGRFLDVSV
jgi:hypothetical protein